MPVRRRSALPALLLLLLLAACNKGAPGGVTPSESQALNDAAEMLDANSVSANAVAADPTANAR